MSISLVVPQLFYDLIARVLPGYLFLTVLQLELARTSVSGAFAWSQSSTGEVDRAISGIGTVFVCYLLGWFLSGLRPAKWSASQKSEADFAVVYKRYQWVRIRSADDGFRIVKLRAEARMLEASCTAMKRLQLTPVGAAEAVAAEVAP